LLSLPSHPSVAGNALGFALSSYPIRRQDIRSVFNELYPLDMFACKANKKGWQATPFLLETKDGY